MREINLHEDNLCSILLNDSFADKVFVLDLFSRLFTIANFVVVKARRPYPNFNLISFYDKMHMLSYLFENKKNKIDLSEIYFTSVKNNEILEVLSDVWFRYEQPTLCFFKSKNDFDLKKDMIYEKNLSWSSIVNSSPCYVVFRGVEEDVLWIGKESKLEFTVLVDNLY